MKTARWRYGPRTALLALALAGIPVSAFAQRGPAIQRLEPSSGPVGTVVYIDGQRFSRTTEVKLGAASLTIDRVMPNRIAARIPPGAKTDLISVKTPEGETRGPEFRITEPLAAPEITGFEPQQGPPGSEVIIRGRNFAARLVSNLVTLGDTPLIVRYASPTELKAIIPEIARTGPLSVQVQNASAARSNQPFRVTAATAIKTFQPKVGPVGSKVVITGAGFSAKPQHNRVYLNNLAMPVERASESELVVKVPERSVTGLLVVDVRGAGSSRSQEAFVVQRAPTVVGFAPAQGAAGSRVKLFGTNFGQRAEAVQVLLGSNKKPLAVSAVKETELVVEVPNDAESGKFAVTVNGIGPAQSAESFQLLPPLRISSFSPTSGPAGTVVVIDGNGFSPNMSQNLVRLGHNIAEVIFASATRLRVRVGSGPSVPLEVSVRGSGTVRSAQPFIVTQP